MQVPVAHAVNPVHALPPHCPYSLWPATAAALVVAAADDVTAVVKVVLTTELLVVAAAALLDVVCTAVLLLAAADVAAAPEPVTAELVAVAAELLCATLLEKPVYSAGPGMV